MLLTALALGACAGSPGPDVTEESVIISAEPEPLDTATGVDGEEAPPAADSTAEEAGADEEEDVALIDRTQQRVYEVATNSVRWFDSFFATGDEAQQGNVSRGLVSAGPLWDERDGLKTRVRFKARVQLPALERRTRLVFGRGDVDDFVDGTDAENVDTLPGRFNDFEDDDWLFGIGYQRDGRLARGWDFGAGVKVSSPVEPYVRATYRWNKSWNDAWLWRVSPRVFWQSQRGEGVTLTNILDYAVNERWLLRSWTHLVAEEQVEGMGWTTKFTAYQSLSGKDAMAYSILARGENRADVTLQDYGVELRYRKRISRDWLFVELSTRLTWPREFLDEVREENFGVGIEFEMQFGDWPGREQGTSP